MSARKAVNADLIAVTNVRHATGEFGGFNLCLRIKRKADGSLRIHVNSVGDTPLGTRRASMFKEIPTSAVLDIPAEIAGTWFDDVFGPGSRFGDWL